MLERLSDLPTGIEAVRATGKVTKEEYEKVLEPLFDAARTKGERLRLLYEFPPEFEGFSTGAAWEDVRFGLGAVRQLLGCAVVTDIGWVRESARFVGFWLASPLKVFASKERANAVEFLRSLPEEPAISHRLLPSGVIAVEIKEALRAQDFDALTLTADAWIQSHGSLNGLVLHAREFPGWENLGGLVKHVRFARDHQAKIKRVALVTDAKAARVVPEIAELFVKAEVQNFAYARLDDAIAWAGGGK